MNHAIAKGDFHEPPTGFPGFRIDTVLRRAWALFQKLSPVDRGWAAGAYLLLMMLGWLTSQTYLEGFLETLAVWLIRLFLSTWLLALFLLPRIPGVPWRRHLPKIVLYFLLLDLIVSGIWTLIISGSAVAAMLVGRLLPHLSLPLLWGMFSPDLLLVVPPLMLLSVAGILVLRWLLGLSLVVPIMLDRSTGLRPAIRASLLSTRCHRFSLLVIFSLAALVTSLPMIVGSLSKAMVMAIPILFPSLLPANSSGVWICFGIQTLFLMVSTLLAIWLWPISSAVWAALYLERWRPAIDPQS